MTDSLYQVDIDEHLKALRTPRPTVEHGVTPEMADKILWHLSEPWDPNSNGCDMEPGVDYPKGLINNPYHATAVVQALARDNDIPSLRNILDKAIEFKIDATDNIRPEAIYAVTYMLADQGGNEAFAKEWMHNFGHTPTKAAAHLKELLDGHSMTIAATQDLLGTAVASEPFREMFILGSTPARAGNFFEIPFGRMFDGLSLKSHEKKSRDAALLLKLEHPNQLPDIQKTDKKTHPLAHMLWTSGKVTLSRCLQTVLEAYGPDNERVNEQMRAGMEHMFDQGAIPVPESMLATDETPITRHPVWHAIEYWGGDDIGKRLWHATAADNEPFLVDLMANASESDTIALIDFMTEHGADLDEMVWLDKSKEGDQTNVATIAVTYTRSKVVGHLLSQDVDVDAIAAHPKTRFKISAAEMADKMVAGARDQGYVARTEAVASLMRSHQAKKQALRAIAELDEPATRVRP